MLDDKFISDRISDLRIKKGVSARDMSLSIGQSHGYINTIENYKAMPSMDTFLYICDYFNIEPKDFFDRSNNDPVLLNELVEDLKRLKKNELEHVAELVKILRNR